MDKKDLTVQCVCRNEPFLYYAIKAIYDYCGTILLYDTESYDEFTLKDIETLLEEDTENKIIYKQSPIQIDETKWRVGQVHEFRRQNRGKRGVAHVRQEQIEDTKTKYFMIVDGDEVHYKEAMEDILKYNMPDHIIMAQVPLVWFYDLKSTFKFYPVTGRIFKTDSVVMSDDTPGHQHLNKFDKSPLGASKEEVEQLLDLKPFAHFETVVKPNRRRNTIRKTEPYVGSLPEVMVENDYYIKRLFESGPN